MVILLAQVTVKPGREEEFIELSQRVLFAASRRDPGCESYRLLRDTEPENGFLWVEKWASQEALDAHFNTSHFAEYMPAVEPLLVGPPDIEVFEASGPQNVAV